MTLRRAGVYTIGLAIAASVSTAPLARAQSDTTRMRVPVKKEQTATPAKPAATLPEKAVTVVPPRDTAHRMAAGDVVVPKDTAPPTLARPACEMMPGAPMMPAARMKEMCGAMMPTQRQQPGESATRYLFGKSGIYVGLGAGTAVPYNQLGNLGYDSGFDLTIPVGWRRPGRTLGLRATLGYDQVHADVATADRTAPALLGSAPDPKIYSATADAVFTFPIGQSAREGRGLSLYALGGGGAYLFRGFGGRTVLADVLGGDEIGTSRKNIHKWGVQAGAGMEYGLGPTALFVESRWVNVFTGGSRTGNDYLRWIPISAGVMLR